MSSIYLSYVEADKSIADRLAEKLRRAGHLVDTSQTDDSVASARERADCTIVIWSPASIGSPSVYEDARSAMRRWLIQIMANGATPDSIPAVFRDETLVGQTSDEEILKMLPTLGDFHSDGSSGIMAALSGYQYQEPTEAERQEWAAEERERDRPFVAALKVEAGKLAHKIPKTMQLGISQTIEVRMSHVNQKSIMLGLVGNGRSVAERLPIVETMSVELHPDPAAFKVVRRSRKTQLVTGPLLRTTRAEPRQFGRWQWLVTPTQSGTYELLLQVSANLTDSQGVPTSTSLPDKSYAVTVHVNYARAAFAAVNWFATGLVSMIAAGFVGAFTQDVWWPALKTWLIGLGLL